MDDARKLLDSLMGSTRNSDMKEVQKKKGQMFKEDNVCKYYLAGWCPAFEGLFHNTKRDMDECTKLHSDAMRSELESHPDSARYKDEYEKQLLRHLEGIVRVADEWIAKERRTLQPEVPNVVAKIEIEKMKEQAKSSVQEAEGMAERGDIEGSKEKIAMADECRKKALDWEGRALAPRTDTAVCEVCGVRTISNDKMTGFDQTCHLAGKTHLGYVKVRAFLEELRQKRRAREGSGSGRQRSRSRSGERGSERGRRGERGGGDRGGRDRDGDRRGHGDDRRSRDRDRDRERRR